MVLAKVNNQCDCNPNHCSPEPLINQSSDLGSLNIIFSSSVQGRLTAPTLKTTCPLSSHLGHHIDVLLLWGR